MEPPACPLSRGCSFSSDVTGIEKSLCIDTASWALLGGSGLLPGGATPSAWEIGSVLAMGHVLAWWDGAMGPAWCREGEQPLPCPLLVLWGARQHLFKRRKRSNGAGYKGAHSLLLGAQPAVLKDAQNLLCLSSDLSALAFLHLIHLVDGSQKHPPDTHHL